jgi:hypothetical protein
VSVFAPVAAILPQVAPIPPAIATVLPNIPAILTNVARLRARGGRISLTEILAPRADVLANVPAVDPCVAAIVTQVAPVAAHFMAISSGIGRLLRGCQGGHAKYQREQRRDDGSVSHGLFLEKGCGSWLRRRQDRHVKSLAVGPRQGELRHRGRVMR